MAADRMHTGTLDIDPVRVCAQLEASIRAAVFGRLKRKGVVIGISGGIDSSTAAALAVRALGSDRVLGLFMPEFESADDSLRLGAAVAAWLGIESRVEQVGPILDAAGCYRRRDDAIRTVVPEYGDGCRCKIVISDMIGGAAYATFSVVVESPQGVQTRVRLPAEAYLAIVAATNFKQRVRKMMEYYHADRLGYAVLGTPNRLEHDQGFFVKNGDGAADLMPIAHLYKTQVYAVAAYLGVPREILNRPPTTDTYSLSQSQEEFFFALPYRQMDFCLYGRDHGIDPDEVAEAASMTAEQVRRAYRMIDSKRRATRYLHLPPLLVEETDAPAEQTVQS